MTIRSMIFRAALALPGFRPIEPKVGRRAYVDGKFPEGAPIIMGTIVIDGVTIHTGWAFSERECKYIEPASIKRDQRRNWLCTKLFNIFGMPGAKGVRVTS